MYLREGGRARAALTSCATGVAQARRRRLLEHRPSILFTRLPQCSLIIKHHVRREGGREGGHLLLVHQTNPVLDMRTEGDKLVNERREAGIKKHNGVLRVPYDPG